MVADIGHDLNIESKQDTDHYHQKSSSTSVGGSFSWGGTSSVNASTSSTKMNSDWASVTDQSGIYAGKGGFDIKVGNNTDLKGGVIASDAPNSSQNRLDTGSISFSDIENKAKYDVKSSSAGISSSGMPSLPTSRNKKESESSITHSAVSDGTIIIRNENEQKQDIAGLSRDTEHANNELKHIFDKEKEQSIIDQTRLVSEIGGETLTMLNNIDRIKATEEAKKAVEAEKQKSQTPLTEQQEQKIYEDAYKKAMDNGMSAMGSNTRQGIDMAVNIINGLISGDMTGAAAGALAPKIASIIKGQTEHYDPITGERKIDYISNTVCHAILGAVVAELQGNSALAGGLGAAASERGAEIIAGMLYPGKSVDKLSQDEKQQISALAQLATALAVAAGGGDIQDINTAVAGGKNAVENNGAASIASKQGVKLCFQNPECKDVATKLIINGAATFGVVLTASQINIDNINELIEKYVWDLSDILLIEVEKGYKNPIGQPNDLDSIISGGISNLPFNEGYPIPEPLPPLPGYEPLDPEELGPNHTGHGGGLDNIEFPNHTGGNQIPEALPPLPGYEPIDPDWINNALTADNRLPIPQKTTASNGLNIESNTKHTPGAQGFRPNAGVEPKNSLEIFEGSISIDGNKHRYGIDSEGNIHRYSPSNNGVYHWSGSTGDKKNPLNKNDIPNGIKKQLGVKGK